MTKFADQIRQGADQAWESLSEGWREISSLASGALTRFWPSPRPEKNATVDQQRPRLRTTSWAFLAADVIETADKVIIRIEAPGMLRGDFNVALSGDVLSVWGEKRMDQELAEGQWRVVQSAYGTFRRDVRLPTTVEANKTKAIYGNGVLRIELPKSKDAQLRRIAVKTA